MKTLFKVALVMLGLGIFIGWKLAQNQQQRIEKAAADAYANDPELVAIRKERARENRIDDWLDKAEGE